MRGVELLKLHPSVMSIDCKLCQLYHYDLKTGKPQTTANGQRIPRPKGTFAPCKYGQDRCPKISPEEGQSLWSRNVRAYDHYLMCRATCSFPDDEIVRRNAATIRLVEDLVDTIRSFGGTITTPQKDQKSGR